MSQVTQKTTDSRVFVKSVDGLAAVFGVSRRQVQRWFVAGLSCRIGRRGYDVGIAVRWRLAKLGDAGDGNETLLEAKTRFTANRADVEAVKLAKLTHRYMVRTDADRRCLEVLNWCAGLFDRAGHELPPRLPGLSAGCHIEVGKAIRDYFEELRSEIATGRLAGPAGDADAGDSEESAP